MRMRQKVPNATGYKPRRKPAKRREMMHGMDEYAKGLMPKRKRQPKLPPTGARMVLLDDTGKGGWIADVRSASIIDQHRDITRSWDGSVYVIPAMDLTVSMNVRPPKYYATTRALLKAAARKPKGVKRLPRIR